MANLMAARTGARSFLEVAKRQRVAWSCSLVVGLFLTWYGHIPVLPVLAGCLLAVSISTMRAWPTMKPKPVIRGGR